MKTFFHLVVLFTFVFVSIIFAQPNLLPSIGMNVRPNDSDSMCHFPTYIDPNGTFMQTGPNVGDTIPDFKLYNLSTDTLHIQKELQKGKPVLLISSSYTCPVYRNKVPLINSLQAQYGNEISIFILYCIEAHPDPDISPYFGYYNNGPQNTNYGIIYPQPKTYGQRKNLVSIMMNAMTINVPVFIDGTCNNWLSYFGPAPNNAYLIDTNGVIHSKHGWFNRHPHNIYNDIQNLLYGSGGGGGNYSGSFLYATLDSIASGTPGETLYGYGKLINNSDSGVLIKVMKLQKNYPAGWSTSICIDACLPPEVDSTTFYLPPGDTQSYTMYFYTDSLPSSGSIRMGFRNVYNQNNRFMANFYAHTTSTGITISTEEPVSFELFQNYPNPFNPNTNIKFNLTKPGVTTLIVYDKLGRELSRIVNGVNLIPGEHSYSFDGSNLSSGIYFYRLITIPEGQSAITVKSRTMLLLK